MTTLTIPNVVFKTRIRDESIGGDNPFRWQDVNTDDIFKGKKSCYLHCQAHLHQPAQVDICLGLKQAIRKLSIRVLRKCIV